MKISFYLPTCIIITLVLITSSGCMARQKRHPKQSRQMQQSLKEDQALTVVQQKIDSQLLQAIKGQKKAAGVRPEPVNVQADATGNLAVDISATVSDSLLNNIKALGGQIIFPSKQYHTIRAIIHLSKVETIAAYQAVTFIQPAAQAINNGAAPAAPGGGLQPPPVKNTADTIPYRP